MSTSLAILRWREQLGWAEKENMMEVLSEVQERRKDRSLVGSKALDVEIQLLERKKSFNLVEEMIKVLLLILSRKGSLVKYKGWY